MKLDEVVIAIQELTNYFNEHKVSGISGDNLSNMIVKLASLNVTLGSEIADMEREADKAEAHHKLRREQVYQQERKNGKTIADSESLRETETEIEKTDWLSAKYAHRLHSILRADVNNLIDAARSKLSYMKQERDKS